MSEIQAAAYARVSSEHQASTRTVASQLSALRERVTADGAQLPDELTFVDEGYSGATLLRPALEQLRDVAASGGMDRLYVHSPDRLARKYAYQVLLIDELQRVGVEVVFLNRELGHSPEDDLLLQVQGMVAEYERAKILERARRGKRHAALAGDVSVLGGAPYGYRYVTKADGGGQARYEVVLEEARVVRRIFEWVGRERLSMGEVSRRLTQEGIPTRTGKARWDRSIIWTMLKNPAYKGAAAFGKTQMGPQRRRPRPQRGHPEQPRRPTLPYPVPSEEWIRIPVPPLVGADLFAAVQEQLEENRRRGKRRPREIQFLVQGLAVCARCGYAYCGAYSGSPRRGGQPRSYGYYRCTGADSYRFGGQPVCDNPATRDDLLDSAVWAEVRALLEDPQRILEEYQRRIDDPGGGTRRDELKATEKQIGKLRQGVGRLIDSYAEGLIEKGEFEPRIRRLKERVAALEERSGQLAEEAVQQGELHLVIGRLEEFTARLTDNLDTLEWQTRREIVRALVKRVEIDHEQVRVVFRIPPGPDRVGSGTAISQDREGRRTSTPYGCSSRLVPTPLGPGRPRIGCAGRR